MLRKALRRSSALSVLSAKRSFWVAPERMPRTETTGRNLITVHPDEGKHSATIIVLHGLGDSANGWIDVAEMWARAMPWVKFIVPSAADRPITMNGGFSSKYLPVISRIMSRCLSVNVSCVSNTDSPPSSSLLPAPNVLMNLESCRQ